MIRAIPALLLVFACLLAPSVAEEAASDDAHPLGVWATLIGGQWHAKGAWEGGTAFEARMVAEWGPGKTNVRARTFIPAEGGEYLRYDAVYFVHPETRKPTYLATAMSGETSFGTFEITEDSVAFEFPGKGVMPPIRSTYRFDGEDRCRWTVAPSGDDDGKLLLDVVYARGELAPLKRVETKPPDRKQLDPLARLVGKFDVKGKLADGDPRHVYVERTWGLGRTIVTDTWTVSEGKKRFKDRSFLWFDDEQKTFRELTFVREVVITEGGYTVDGDDVTRAWTIHADGNVSRFQRKVRIESADRHVWDDTMKLPSGRIFKFDHDMVATRVK